VKGGTGIISDFLYFVQETDCYFYANDARALVLQGLGEAQRASTISAVRDRRRAVPSSRKGENLKTLTPPCEGRKNSTRREEGEVRVNHHYLIFFQSPLADATVELKERSVTKWAFDNFFFAHRGQEKGTC